MNSILMVVVAVFIILLVFIMFSMDDPEEAPGEPPPPPAAEAKAASSQDAAPSRGAPEPRAETAPSGVPTSSSTAGAPAGRAAPAGPLPPLPALPVKGSDDDFQFRQILEAQWAPVTAITRSDAVLAVVQIRFPESLMGDPAAFATALARAESVLDPAKAPFPHQFRVALASQTSQIWIFGFDDESDDPAFEGVLTAFNAVSRFKKALEGDPVLFEAKARLAIGMSTGETACIHRGPLGLVTYAGKALFLAEALSHAAGDFQVYLDEAMHRLAQPWFDFREWKPMKLWQNLPPVAFFEVVGWNKKEDIFAYTSHQDALVRRAVAVAYRYLEFDDVAPLLELISDPDERVALEALNTLAEIKDERAMGILKKILPEAKNPTLRSAVIKALGALGREEILPVLLASTRDVHWQIRFHAAKAMYAIAGVDALRHLEHMVDDEDGAVRACIREILYRRDKDSRHLAALRELLGDLSTRARKAAIEALAALATRDSLHILAAAYFDQEPALQRFILRQLRDARSPDAYECFLSIFRHADDAQRSEIMMALRRARLG
ncbi:MAG: HEAT repeat-containing protein [Candidatus Ozemobacter sibiricus]|jgi:hypothetical protein|uniref:HEAT repeat-containing protein n=1 Tax=Candidatus Ozemobacter sibiricus TaxID=2268124 RepID=A0A367ZQQ0_9BACT|nr:MAG: HEAT repeat-containing protein [Candidatus Ozemobacter sibiricus]